MAKTFHCKLITPEARVLDEPVTYANLPLWDGQAGILTDRAPLLAKLGLGELTLRFPEGGDRSYFVSEGFAQMVGNELTLLAQVAIPAEELSEKEARAEVAEAQARTPQDEADAERVGKERRTAEAKLRVAQSFRARGGGI